MNILSIALTIRVVMDSITYSKKINIIKSAILYPKQQDVMVLAKEKPEKEIVEDILSFGRNEKDWDESFFIGNLDVVYYKYLEWKKFLPRIKPFYAVKCNPLRPVINLLAELGVGFDCASKNEIAEVLACGSDPCNIVLANTNKFQSHLEYARNVGVNLTIFDNKEELIKLKKFHKNASLLLRINADDDTALINFRGKFGANLEYAKELIVLAKKMGLDLKGIHFHVGTGCQNISTYDQACKDSRKLFDFAKDNGFNFTTLDIGGGFPGLDTEEFKFSDIARVVNSATEKYFSGIELNLIAEPGRFFVEEAFGIVTNVIGKRTLGQNTSYYVGDSLYSAFNNVMIENQKLFPVPLNCKEFSDTSECTVYGVTCDGIDVISTNLSLPDIEVGSWLLWKKMGAYSVLISFGFNGFITQKAYYYMTEKISDSIRNDFISNAV